MNILFTHFCNRSCPYCFAKGKFIPEKTVADSCISLRNLKIAIDFLKKSKQNRVGILGGEPTLHPEFKKAISFIIKQGIYAQIFTNGLIKKDTVLFLKRIDKKKYGLVLNINSPGAYTRKEESIINRTLRLLGGGHISLAFTIYQKDFNIDFTAKLIRKYNLDKRIRIGIAAPLVGRSNEYLPREDFAAVSGNLVRFVEKNQASGIVLSFDCGFTLCNFNDVQLGKLIRGGASIKFYCSPAIDVGSDLTVWRCFVTSMLWNKKLSDFKNLDAATNFYKKKFIALQRAGSADNCLRCSHLDFDRCHGGCLGHTIKLFKLEDKLQRLAGIN
jgi:MoaA/NifB/PqqE/SkfB family radical SAM enzyme